MKISELYEKQADVFFDLIMQSDQQWRKSWADKDFTQRNGLTDNGYSNLNQSLLFKRAVVENLEDPRWLTFAQAKEAGYTIKKGSKGSQIFRIVTKYTRQSKDEQGRVIKDDNGEPKTETLAYEKPILKTFTVFNARDIDGIEPFKRAELSEAQKELLKQENYQRAEAMVQAYCQKYDISLQEIASAGAFHSYAQSNNGATEKKVVVPLKAQFNTLDDYFSVLFHEVGHSTKHLGIRINQETDTPHGNYFGSTNYAKEELTAELTALLLCKEFNIDSTSTAQTENNSVAYLASWIESGALTKEDFKIAVQEANRSAKAIFAEAPAVKLTENIQTTQEQKQELTDMIMANIDMSLITGAGLGKNSQENELSDSTAKSIAEEINRYPNKIEAKAILAEILDNAYNKGECNDHYRQETLSKINSELDVLINKKLNPDNIGLSIYFCEHSGKANEKEAYLKGKEAYNQLQNLLDKPNNERGDIVIRVHLQGDDIKKINDNNPINNYDYVRVNTIDQKKPMEAIKELFANQKFHNKEADISHLFVLKVLENYVQFEKNGIEQPKEKLTKKIHSKGLKM